VDEGEDDGVEREEEAIGAVWCWICSRQAVCCSGLGLD
jgi:hypothetical protein